MVVLATACQPGAADQPGDGSDTGGGETASAELLQLSDADLFRFTLRYQVQSASILAGDGGQVSWTGLGQDAHGRAIDPVADVANLLLLKLVDGDLQTRLDALAAGSLAQSSVSLRLHCEPVEATCQLAELDFEAGHPVDINKTFAADTGPWLVWLSPSLGGEPLALLELRPQLDGPKLAILDDGVSVLSASAAADQSDPLPVPIDGDIELSWSGIATSSQGAALSPFRLDRAILARVAVDSRDDDRLLRLADSAEQAWQADISGSQALRLADMEPLVPAAGGPVDLSGAGQWLLALHCTSCAVPQPAVLVALAPE